MAEQVSTEVPRLARLARGEESRTDFPCPYARCDGTGFVLEEGTDSARPCECRPQRIAVARTRKLSHHIPKKFQGLGFDRPPVTNMDDEVVREVRRFCRRLDENLDEGRGLWFWGGPGTGKTTLAMLVSQEALKARRSVAIYSLPALLTEIRTTYDQSSEHRYDRLIEQLTTIDLLHIDDMAVARTNEWVLEQLYTVVNSRYETQRSMVFTADVERWFELGRHVGERTFSRLQEMCGAPIPMHGGDQRIGLGAAARAGAD
jgi:DNA replication protein DnaC